jgi:hypothetical protein
MRRLEFLRSQVDQCERLARALPPCKVREELERVARERQSEIDVLQSDKSQSKGRSAAESEP